MYIERKDQLKNIPSFFTSNNQPPKHKKKKSIRYCLYARKLSESDERQAISIDSQVKEMLEYAQNSNIKVKNILRESYSAKESRQRSVFNQLIDDIKLGKYSAIISWSIDRLSRNAGDLGVLVDLMDNGFLTEIRTYNQKFRNSPNDKFLLMILGSQAKLENDNRGINAKRGMKAKCEMGYRPTMAPLGFINNRANHTIKIDRKKISIVKKMFQKVAYQGYSGRDIFRWLDKIGFKTRKNKRVSYSMIYSILNNPYYCGIFEFPKGSGKWYKTKHKAVISRDLFNKVQKKLVVCPKTWPNTKKFDYTKILKCGACGSGVTASEKIKTRKDSTKKQYVYYHCTKFRNLDCKEPYIREEDLTKQLKKLFNEMLIIKQMKNNKRVKYKMEEFIDFGVSVYKFCKQNEPKIRKNPKKIDEKSYIKYVFECGSKQEKQDLLKCLNTDIFLKNRKVYI